MLDARTHRGKHTFLDCILVCYLVIMRIEIEIWSHPVIFFGMLLSTCLCKY